MLHRPLPVLKSVLAVSILMQLAASGCRDLENPPQKASPEIQRQDTSPSADLRWLAKEDPSCQADGLSVAVSEITVYEWDGRQTAPKKVSFKGSAGPDREFVSQNITGSLIGFVSDYNCTISATGVESCKVDKAKVQPEPTAFRMCRANATYARESLESLTLTSQYYTESAYSFYEAIAGRKSGIIKSILVPQPIFMRHFTKADGTTSDRVDVNNASFASIPADGDQAKMGAFFIFPTSQKSFAASGVNLWEVPFVMRHEFGHHVLSHYLDKTLGATSLRLAKDVSLESIMPVSYRKHSSEAAFGLASGVTAPQFALDGINETFADLFAYFAGNSAKAPLAGVRCLDVSRDPSSAVTARGSKKGLDSARVAIYEGRSAPLKSDGCSEPQFDDEHDIATALGQPMASFIEQATPNLDASVRGEVLLAWASNLKILVATPSNVSLDTLVVELVKAVKQKNPNVTSACVHFKAAITGLPKASAACAN